MWRRLMATRATVPNLVLAQRVIDKMTSAAQRYIEDETGEAMIGVITPGEHTNGVATIYVLDTISPDESAVRQLHTFQQGDERQDELIWWLQENWHVQREKRRGSYGSANNAKWDVPLRYLGDWHKQPGFMIAPSHGDLMTALDWLDDDNGMDALLVPIVTLDHPATLGESTATVNYIMVPTDDGTNLRVDWWYIHRDVRAFQAINPVVYPDEQLPGLTQYPWHLVNEAWASTEFARLQADNLFLSVILWDTDDKLPLEICLLMARQGSPKVLIITTHWNFPDSPPTARVAPMVSMDANDDIYDVFEDLWVKSEPVADPTDWDWTKERTLLDYVHTIETSLGLRSQEDETISEESEHDLG
jgi:hypothetical protein